MKFLDKIEEYICVIGLGIMTILVFANVVSRYVLHMSLSYSEEITTGLFTLISMVGTAVAAKRRAHLGLSILTDAVAPKPKKVLLVLGFGLSTVFSLLVFIYGILMVKSQVVLGQVTSSMQWPEWIYGMFVPIGAVFMTIRFAQATIEEWRAEPGELLSDEEAMIADAAAAAAKEREE